MSARANDPNSIVFGGEPRADLLPPEVHLRAKARATRRNLVFMVVVAIVIAGGGWATAFLYAAQAQLLLSAAHEETARLAAEQLKYSEATKVANAVEFAERARRTAVVQEIVWADLLADIRSYLPENVVLDSASMRSNVAWSGTPLDSSGVLGSPRIATVELVFRSESLFDTTFLIRELAQLPGFAGASPDSVTHHDVFVTNVTLSLDEGALNDRFADAAGEATEGEASS